MKDVYITITGAFKFHGTGVFIPGQLVKLEKEPNNPKDSEAIKVLLPGGIKAGYVANSVHTVAKGTHSAGRIYDKFENEAFARIMFVSEDLVIAEFLGWSEEYSRLFSKLEPSEDLE